MLQEKFRELNGAAGDVWSLERDLNKLREEKKKEEAAAAEKKEGEKKKTPNSAKIGPKDAKD